MEKVSLKRRPDRRLIIALVAGLVALCLCVCLVGAAALFLFADDAVVAGEDYPAAVAVDAPAAARVGEPFIIEVVVENRTFEAHQLHSIDVDLSYLQGVEITGSDPQFVETFLLTPVLPQRTFSFGTAIPAGETVVIELQASPTAAGAYSGSLDICINSGGNCRSSPLQTQIE
ncbi:MAG: hypothetical protein R3272_00185 [Candidatus Promineifilaceae bacterium]|nr:hypothetical protein [Candidatus Promineifilaceae bacterium]